MAIGMFNLDPSKIGNYVGLNFWNLFTCCTYKKDRAIYFGKMIRGKTLVSSCTTNCCTTRRII